MAYTTVDQVRSHLVPTFALADRVNNQAVTLSGTGYISFFNGSVDGGSVVVKSLRDTQLCREDIHISDGKAQLTSGFPVPGSVVIATDSSLGRVFVENRDYAVDYGSGRLVVKDGGDLPANGDAVAWSCPFTTYLSDADFRLDASRGTIARLNGGAIADGEIIHVDYVPQRASFDDDVLAAAVREANGQVERDVDPGQEFGADPVLVSAATYRALGLVCRTAAARELAGQRGLDRIAAGWLNLAEDYSAMADRLLDGFRPPLSGPSSPTHS